MAYQDGETRVINGVTYRREGGSWRKQGSLDEGGAPVRVRGIQTQKTQADTVRAENMADASIYAPRQAEVGIGNTESTIADRAQDNRRDDIRLAADLASKGYKLVNGEVVRDPNWKPPLPADAMVRREGETKRAATVENLIGEAKKLYESNIKGQPASRAFGLTEFVDDLPGNQEFTAASNTILPLIRPLVAQTAKEGDSDKEMQIFQSYIPHNDDNDQTIERKFKSLEILIDGMIKGRAPSQTVNGRKDPVASGMARLEQRLAEILPKYPKEKHAAIRQDAYRRYNADPRVTSLKNAPRKNTGWKIERIGD